MTGLRMMWRGVWHREELLTGGQELRSAESFANLQHPEGKLYADLGNTGLIAIDRVSDDAIITAIPQHGGAVLLAASKPDRSHPSSRRPRGENELSSLLNLPNRPRRPHLQRRTCCHPTVRTLSRYLIPVPTPSRRTLMMSSTTS